MNGVNHTTVIIIIIIIIIKLNFLNFKEEGDNNNTYIAPISKLLFLSALERTV